MLATGTIEPTLCPAKLLPFIGTIALLQDSACQQALSNEHHTSQTQDSDLVRLYNELLSDYVKDVRPVFHYGQALNVTFGFSLAQVIDVDERNQILTTNTWINMNWVDVNLQWDPHAFRNITDVHIPHDHLWKPDIVLNNKIKLPHSADSKYPQGTVSTDMIVRYDGHVTWLSAVIFQSSCAVNVRYYPFDEQICVLSFASWAYDGTKIDLMTVSEKGDQTNYMKSSEWKLMSIGVQRQVTKYSCCPQPFPYIDVTIRLQRRPMFYVFNLILPCTMISFIALLVFWVPSDSGEKVSTGITTLLSMTVFLMMVAESMPPTADSIPLIGMHYGVTTTLACISTALSVLTLNTHYKGMETGHPVPRCVHLIAFHWIAPLIRVPLDQALFTGGSSTYGASWHLNTEYNHVTSRSPQSPTFTLDALPRTPIRYQQADGIERFTEKFQTAIKRVHKAIQLNQERLLERDRRDAIVEEWKQVATVLDRALLVLFAAVSVSMSFGLVYQKDFKFRSIVSG